MTIPTATLLVAYGQGDEVAHASFATLAEQLAARLNHLVIVCALDEGQRPLLNAISQALQGGAIRLIILPLLLSPAQYKSNAIGGAVAFASRRFPFLQFHLSPPIAWESWVTVATAGLPAHTNHDSTALILATQHASAEVNSDLAKLVRLVYEANPVGWVEIAFTGNDGRPSLPAMIRQLKRLGAQQLIILPWVLFAGTAVDEINAIAVAEPQTIITPHLVAQPTLLETLVQQHHLALADRSLLPISWTELERQLAAEFNTHDKMKPGQRAPDEDEYLQLTAKINAILPPRYQGQLESVSAAPMAAADLLFDDDGQVLWAEIFGFDDPDSPFCELALAGGPSHRGELLEAITAASCAADMGKYTAVVAEIERGIQMITGLPTVKSDVLGWVGVQCDSDEMAIWMVRAIIVENVMVRRQGNVLYLPAGSHFTLKNEIKSIVTVTAKTWHYWSEHITFQQMLKVRSQIN